MFETRKITHNEAKIIIRPAIRTGSYIPDGEMPAPVDIQLYEYFINVGNSAKYKTNSFEPIFILERGVYLSRSDLHQILCVMDQLEKENK